MRLRNGMTNGESCHKINKRNEGGLINEIKIEIYCEDTVRDL